MSAVLLKWTIWIYKFVHKSCLKTFIKSAKAKWGSKPQCWHIYEDLATALSPQEHEQILFYKFKCFSSNLYSHKRGGDYGAWSTQTTRFDILFVS